MYPGHSACKEPDTELWQGIARRHEPGVTAHGPGRFCRHKRLPKIVMDWPAPPENDPLYRLADLAATRGASLANNEMDRLIYDA